MPKTEELVRRIFDACYAGATRMTIEPKPDGEDGGLKFMVFIRSEKPGGPSGHSVCPNLGTAFDRALSGFEGKIVPVELDEEAESLL